MWNCFNDNDNNKRVIVIKTQMHSNYPNPRYIFPGGRSMKTSQIPMFLHIAASLGSTLTYINMKTVRFYVETAINLQRKCLGTPDCKNMENMLINFIWRVKVQDKYLMETIFITLNEIWLYESDPNAPITCSEPGGKQRQHSIRGWRNLNYLCFVQCFA